MGAKPMRDRRRKGKAPVKYQPLRVHVGRLDRSAVTPKPEDLPV